MKTAYYIAAALALATAGAAFGAEANGNEAASASVPVAAALATAKAAPAAHPLTRAEVRAQAVEARRNGTLIETEADMDVAQTRKQIAQ
ncbi:DUF4148 domain-containing protein [Pseudoduganella plicata]|uniref:DUF4148 domain-containing protein n=1 Tax=Pseudoduganella plicata TaxID=321984 RepID=A0A4P7BLY6_9BURK|nr:DUF4148 domain-containing protein [Pseudoduganella plicata]QBQ38745.1 DUF4148 domain-containing protein [Pseudoduganella plicata]GGY84747.1 hypothetical protein GCM10007388_17390 [Pseudoduganella plicata]